MTDLMELLFQFLQEKRIPEFLAKNPEYRQSTYEAESRLEALSESLDQASGVLLDEYLEAACTGAHFTERAIFQATLDLAQELRDKL